ncbi:MAG: protease pro-enzyme activation domain-containing protein, partial [Candidatus Acidiferrum sp.]
MKTPTPTNVRGIASLLASLLFVLTFAGAAAEAQTTPAADAAIAAPRARVTQAIDENQLVRLHGNVHPMAKPANDRGALSDAQPITRMYLLLQRSGDQELALEQLIADQQNKNSANFHAFLTPQTFGKQFGPADSDIAAVTSWLASHGFQGMKVSNGRTIIEFNGTVGAVRSAFHTDIHQYSVHGETHFANVSDPQIPAALTPVIGGIVGMHNFHPKSFMKHLGTFEHIKATGEIRPAFTYTDSNGTFYGVGPGDFAKIYNIPAGATGAGQSIAIVGQSNINLQDVADFRTMFALAPNVPTVVLNGPDPGLVSGDEGESDLDVEWAGAVAQAANIIFVTSETTETDGEAGVDASAVYIVDNLVAPVLSESYGICEPNLGNGGNEFYAGLWQQAAAEGITVLIAAGDDGPAGCDDPNSEDEATGGLAVSGTASTVYNIAVGGTDFNQNAGNFSTYWNAATSPISVESAKSYIPEIPWNDSCGAGGLTSSCATGNTAAQSLFAGSGGPSNCATQDNNGNCTAGYQKPPWQSLLGAPTINDGVRDIPDVSLFASGGTNSSFYIICES